MSEILKGVRTSLPRLFLPGRTTPVMKRPSVFHMQTTHLDKDGNVLWQGDWEDNLLHDEGELFILSAAFNTGYTGYGAPPAQLFIGCDNRASAAEGDTLASLSAEGGIVAGRVSGGGYSRVAVNTNGTTAPFFEIPGQMTPATPAGATAAYYVRISGTNSVEWTASDDWSTVSKYFVATHQTAVAAAAGARLIATVPMSQARDLNIGDKLAVQIKIALSEV